MKKLISMLMSILMVSSLLAGCQSNTASTESKASSGGSVTVNFWSAPQKVQYDFWLKKAKAFNSEKKTTNGKTITVKVQEMPESPSSEAGIQNSIVTGTCPALSENVSRSFASTLVKSGVVYDMQDEQWFKDIVANKEIENTIKDWAINSKQYVLPEYVNPMTWQWNAKALKALGISKVPETVDDVNNVVKAFMNNKGKMKAIGVTHTLYRPQILRADQWWERWYDFQMPYMSLSQKTSWTDGSKLTLDRQGAIDAFEFIGNMGDTVQTSELSDLWTAKQPSAIFSISAPWDIQNMRSSGKTYGMDGDYVYGPSIVKKNGDMPYNFADTKGIVLYKNNNISEDQHNGAEEFLKWVYGKDNCAQTDLDWLKATMMIPVRGDISDNKVFSGELSKYPELKDLVEFSKYSIPCMASEKMTDIQTALGESGFTPYMQAAKKTKPFNAPDASKYVDSAFSAMKSKGGLS